MALDLQFDFSIDEDRRIITVAREFAAHRQLVWDCHTKRELLDQWFAPKPLRTQTKHMDFRAGGYWHYAMLTPDNQKFWNRLDYRTVSPIDSYTAQDGFCDEAGIVNAKLPGSFWTVRFVDKSTRTLVTTVVEYASAESLQAAIAMGLKDGLASTMERLDELLPMLQAADRQPA